MLYPHLIKKNKVYVSIEAVTSKLDIESLESDVTSGVLRKEEDVVYLKKQTYLRKEALVRLAFNFSDEVAKDVFDEIYSAHDLKVQSSSPTPKSYFESPKIESISKSRSTVTVDMISSILKHSAKNKSLRDDDGNLLAEAIYVEVFRGISVGLFGFRPSEIVTKLQKDNGGFYADSYPFRENLTNWAEAEVLKLELDILLNIEGIILSSNGVDDFKKRLKSFISSKRLKRKLLKEERVVAFKEHSKFQAQVIVSGNKLSSRIVMK